MHNKVPISFADLGEKTVKNIERPIRVYYVILEGTPAIAGPAPALRRQERLTQQWVQLRKVEAESETPLPSQSEGQPNVARTELRLATVQLEQLTIRPPIEHGAAGQCQGRRIGGSVLAAAAHIARRSVGAARARGAR